MCNVSRLRLQKKQQVAVFLRLIIIGEDTFLDFSSIFEMTGDFVLLQKWFSSQQIHKGHDRKDILG